MRVLEEVADGGLPFEVWERWRRLEGRSGLEAGWMKIWEKVCGGFEKV